MPRKQPGPIPEGDRANFSTLQTACRAGDLCLVSAIRKSDGKRVSLVCAMNTVNDGGQTFYCPAPLAVLVESNPFDLFDDPLAEE
jgi:hypothetical protein